MGMETLAGFAIGSQLLGAGLQYGENKAARKRSQQVADQGSAIAGAPLGVDSAIAGKINSGQDSYLQYLRSDPSALKPFMFDSSKAFADLQANDQQNITDQANQLSAGAGSLGARFGSGFAAKDAILRSRFAGDIATRNAGIAQSSFNNALNTGFTDYNAGQSRQMQLLQLLSSNQLGQRGQQLQALGLGASQPYPGSGSLVSGTGSDISQLMLLMQYLGKSGGTPTTAPTAPAPQQAYY